MNDDTISRQAAIDAVCHQYCASSDETETALGDAIDEIRSLPSAERRGQWILKYGNGHIEKSIVGGECSLCGFVGPATRYCPNCGAKMGEVKE